MRAKPVTKPANDPSHRFSAEEWHARAELAACYRLLSRYRMTDLTNTHVSVRLPGPEEHYLLNPYGLLYEEITASSLVKYDGDGRILDDSSYGLNPAGYAIHTAVHRAQPDAYCVLHTHTRAGCGVASLEDGLLPLNQMSMIFYNRIAYSDYAYVEQSVSECDQMVKDLGEWKALVMRNHGLLTTGRTVSEAFVLMFYLDKSCEIQLDVLSTGRELHLPAPEVCEQAAQGWWVWYKNQPFGQLDWDALVRQLNRVDQSYLS